MVGKLLQPPRRLGILTGGGDVPGLNAAIKSVVYRAEPQAIEIIGLRAGWEGITFLNRDLGIDAQEYKVEDASTWEHSYVRGLSRLKTRSIDRHGGTILQSTRTNPARVRVGDLPPHLAYKGAGHSEDDRIDLTDQVIKNIDFLGLDGLIVIGGDDTLSYAAKLSSLGVPLWAIPKTMDNDVPGTEYAIGFQTAVTRAAEFIGRMRSTAGSHRETVVFRMFGRDAGFTALETAMVTWTDRVLIPEVPTRIDRLAELVSGDRQNPSSYSIIVLSEGANLGVTVPETGLPDAYGHRKKANVAEYLAEELSLRLPNVRFLPVDLTYILRSGGS
jgi:6-phosphofructokinase 1